MIAMKSALPITDPRHPLQMDLSAAERHVSKWRNIAACCGDDASKRTWARANLAYHEGRVEGFKKLISEEKGAA